MRRPRRELLPVGDSVLYRCARQARTPGLRLDMFQFVFGIVQKKDLMPGNHIYCWRRGWSYSHHGIVVATEPCGEDCAHTEKCVSVVHYTPDDEAIDDDTATKVRISSLQVFSEGRGIALCKYGASTIELRSCRAGTCVAETSDPPHRVVLRALSLVGWGSGQYNLLTKNCEVISRWCKLGSSPNLPDPRVARGTFVGQSDIRRFTPALAAITQVAESTPTGAVIVAGVAGTAFIAMQIAEYILKSKEQAAAAAAPAPPQVRDHKALVSGILLELLCRLGISLPLRVAEEILPTWRSCVFLADLLAVSLGDPGTVRELAAQQPVEWRQRQSNLLATPGDSLQGDEDDDPKARLQRQREQENTGSQVTDATAPPVDGGREAVNLSRLENTSPPLIGGSTSGAVNGGVVRRILMSDSVGSDIRAMQQVLHQLDVGLGSLPA